MHKPSEKSKKTSKQPSYRNPLRIVGLLFSIFVFILLFYSLVFAVLNGLSASSILGVLSGLLFGVLFLTILFKAFTLEGQLKTQRYRREMDKERQHDELYKASIKDLSDVGSIYGLEQIAKESKKWAPRIADIFCKHIRSTTSKGDYQTKYKNHPAVEVATIMEVLTTPDGNPFNSTKFNLRGANLTGIDLRHKILTGANLEGANLTRTQLANANLTSVNLFKADLTFAGLTEVNLTGANLNFAVLRKAELGGADLKCTRLSKVNLSGAFLENAKLDGSFSGDSSDIEKTDFLKTRIDKPTDLTGCIFGDDEPTSLNGISYGVFTRGLYDAITKDRGTGKTDTEDRYRDEHSIRRKPTQTDKERLVGKDNVDKCKWGDVYVLGVGGIQRSLEL